MVNRFTISKSDGYSNILLIYIYVTIARAFFFYPLVIPQNMHYFKFIFNLYGFVIFLKYLH